MRAIGPAASAVIGAMPISLPIGGPAELLRLFIAQCTATPLTGAMLGGITAVVRLACCTFALHWTSFKISARRGARCLDECSREAIPSSGSQRVENGMSFRLFLLTTNTH